MSQTASLNGVEVSAVDNIDHWNDLGQDGKIFESVRSDKLSQHVPYVHDNNCSGNYDQREGTNAPIADSFRSSQKPPSFNEEKSKHSPSRAGAMPMNDEHSRDESIEKLVDLFRDFLEAAPNPNTGLVTSSPNHSHTRRNMPGRKKLFGLNKGLGTPEGGTNNRYDYEQKYPRDRFGEETAPNARVWLTYLDEAEAFDRERVEGWKDTVDVLLVFAGLFSGVITNFISQASQNLQQNSTQVTASLLFETVQILRAHLNGIPINNVPSSTITPTSPFTPSTNASLVNGLWYTSLAITLSTALFAVLAKQWLYYYLASISGTANQKVRARQLRFNGFEQWNVAAIIDLLPILLYTAVGLFLIGIIILLFPLDSRIAWTIFVITSITFILYFASVILPIRYPECPYTTSSTIYAGILFFVLRECFRWITTILNKSFRDIWNIVDFRAQSTILHLVHYTLGLFQHLFMFISQSAGDVRRGLRRHRPRIFSANFPKFSKWREENIKQAVSNTTVLDSQAVNWLYTASSDRSVRRIITRSVAVNPTIGGQFEYEKIWSLSNTLDVSKTDILDLRHGLCLDLLSGDVRYGGYWHLLQSIPDHLVESTLEEAEYKSYLQIDKGGFPAYDDPNSFSRLITDLDSVKLPLAMWCYLLKRISRDHKMVAHILKHGLIFLFYGIFDPTRELIHNAGLVHFSGPELGWWRFVYLFDYFKLGDPDFSSEAKSRETSYLLFITVYRQLTSVDSVIPDKAERQICLFHLFDSFSISSIIQTRDHRVTFLKEVLFTDSFWSESMAYGARNGAVRCMGCISAENAVCFPFTDYHELSFIYQWCSRDLDRYLSEFTSPIFTVLLLSQNRHHLFTILSNDPEAPSRLSTCLRNMNCRAGRKRDGDIMYPLLMDFLKSVKMPLFTVIYNSSVLVQVWKLLLISEQDPKQFFLLVKSKLDREKLDELFTAMNGRGRLDDPKDSSSRDLELHWHKDTRLDFRLQASLLVFEQIIGQTQEVSTPSSAMLDKDYDDEERAQVSSPNERQVFHTIANRTKKAFKNVWSKPPTT